MPQEPDKTLRSCLCEPIPQILEAAAYLDQAVTAHLKGSYGLAEDLIRRADMPAIRSWLEPIWADSSVHLRVKVSTALSPLTKDLRAKARGPTAAIKAEIHHRDGYSCRFCGMPVIRAETRSRIRSAYPAALPWGRKNAEQHAGFQVMWAQYDHVVPHAKGGSNELNNLVLTCAACNFGRAGYTLEEVAVTDPRLRPPHPSSWDGLERFQ